MFKQTKTYVKTTSSSWGSGLTPKAERGPSMFKGRNEAVVDVGRASGSGVPGGSLSQFLGNILYDSKIFKIMF